MTQPYYIRKSDAAELLAITERTVNRYIAAGHLPEYELPGGHKRLDKSEVLGLPKRSQRGAQA